MRYLLLFLLCLAGCVLGAQTSSALKLKNWEIRPILGFQGWATYTHGAQVFDPAANRYVDVDNRLNMMVRRLRFGATAKIGDRFFLKFLGAGDFIGSDQLAGTIGGVNNGGFPNLQLWDFFAQYRLTPRSDGLYVVGGYLRPTVGRESISGAFGVSSFEKGFLQWYLRQHLTGTGPGGTGGLYLGGRQDLGQRVHLDYRFGVWNAQNDGITTGAVYAPLLTQRVGVAFGDAERAGWAHGLPAANSFGRRRTVSVAVSHASEGPTTTALGGISSIGVDGVVDLGHVHLEGEFHRLRRRAAEAAGLPDNTSSTYLVRAGFNIDVSPEGTAADERRYLEPSLMVYGFNGATTLAEYQTVLATNYFGATERVTDVGLNYHLRPGKVRIGLHYTTFDGDRGELPETGRLAWAWMQGGIGGVRRGSYVGFELILNY